jgi:hypothetical protein
MVICIIHALNTDETLVNKPILPTWIMQTSVPETLETASFASGSALALLHVVLTDPNIATPTKLLRQRLALKAAVQCLKIEGRGDDEAAIRDAHYLTKLGDMMGPGGDMLALWNNAVLISFRNTSVAGWREKLASLLPDHMQDVLSDWLDRLDDQSIRLNPVAQAAEMLAIVLEDFPREEAIALLLADVVLARALGQQQVMPLMARYMKRKPLQEADDFSQLNLACHHAITKSAQEAIRLSHDLTRRAARLKNVAPKLRAKASDKAVELFLSEDAVSPSSMLAPKIKGTNISMTDRSARRLCDRLVELGVIRELTGRSTFRLYGV